MFTVVEQVVHQVSEDDPLVAEVGRAVDQPELAAHLVLGEGVQRQLLLAAVHLVAAAVLDVLDHGGGEERHRPEHLCPAQKMGVLIAMKNQVILWALKMKRNIGLPYLHMGQLKLLPWWQEEQMR